MRSAGSVRLNAKPAYTTAYTIHPVAITARRPIRSDQLPPASDTVVLTTCSAAHMSGMNRTPPAAFGVGSALALAATALLFVVVPRHAAEARVA